MFYTNGRIYWGWQKLPKYEQLGKKVGFIELGVLFDSKLQNNQLLSELDKCFPPLKDKVKCANI